MIYIISPHPDDALIGCYSVLKSDVPHAIFILSNGDKYNATQVFEALSAYKHIVTHYLGFPDGYLDEHKKEIKKYIYHHICKTESNTLYIPHSLDGHVDHEFLYELLKDVDAEIIFYETWVQMKIVTSMHRVEGKADEFKKLFPTQTCYKTNKHLVEVLPCFKNGFEHFRSMGTLSCRKKLSS